MVEDEEILRGLAVAKPEAFHRFFEAWFARVYAFALLRLWSHLHAEAVTRAALRRALEEAPGLDPATPIAPWLLAHVRGRLRGRDEGRRPEGPRVTSLTLSSASLAYGSLRGTLLGCSLRTPWPLRAAR